MSVPFTVTLLAFSTVRSLESVTGPLSVVVPLPASWSSVAATTGPLAVRLRVSITVRVPRVAFEPTPLAKATSTPGPPTSMSEPAAAGSRASRKVSVPAVPRNCVPDWPKVTGSP